MKACAVIGANFGDEGKGLIVDYLSSSSTLVVRFNGGPQAAHTVERNGVRHVFKHYGAGTFNKAATYFSKFALVHPIFFRQETENLNLLGFVPELYVNPKCQVVTPYDMLLNQVIESNLGVNRLGSTGTGVSEAIIRSREYPLTVLDIFDPSLELRLRYIRDVYVPKRLTRAGVTNLRLKEKQLLDSLDVMENFIADCIFFSKKTIVGTKVIKSFNNVVFEGAQGLLLDFVTGTYPHVTRSRTGITNVLKLCDELDIDELEVVYVTRPYITRHGAGPLEWIIPPIGRDETNTFNQYQGSLLYAMLDVGLLGDRIKVDLRQGELEPISITPTLAVTCLDQVDPERFWLLRYGRSYTPNLTDEPWGPENLGRVISRAVGDFSYHYESRGPSANFISKVF